MAERSKALRSGRSPHLWAWVRIPLLTYTQPFVIANSPYTTTENANFWGPIVH